MCREQETERATVLVGGGGGGHTQEGKLLLGVLKLCHTILGNSLVTRYVLYADFVDQPQEQYQRNRNFILEM